MTTVELTWDVPGSGSDHGVRIAVAIAGLAKELVAEHFPDLQEAGPWTKQMRFQQHFDESGWFGVRVEFVSGPSMMMIGGRMKEADVDFLKSKIGKERVWLPSNLCALLGRKWIAFDCFTYVGPYEGRRVSWQNIDGHVRQWLSHIVLPEMLNRERTRVRRALPIAPSFDSKLILDSLWVLESDEDYKQGTAFALDGVGLVTCAHVLGASTRAFRADDFDRKMSVEVVARDDDIDLAILRMPVAVGTKLSRGSADSLDLMEQLLVAGHPNYRLGDRGFVMPGIVVGFRTRSGIRRIVTNASIVAGTSGGPVVGGDGLVIGVAVTGAELFLSTNQTEDMGIVPIDALRHLAK